MEIDPIETYDQNHTLIVKFSPSGVSGFIVGISMNGKYYGYKSLFKDIQREVIERESNGDTIGNLVLYDIDCLYRIISASDTLDADKEIEKIHNELMRLNTTGSPLTLTLAFRDNMAAPPMHGWLDSYNNKITGNDRTFYMWYAN